jgi:biopolymer transport protein ExbB
MFDFVAKGGIMMIPIGFCSVLTVAIIIERAYRFHEAGGHSGNLVPKLRDLIARKKFDEALEICQESRGVVAGVLRELIRNRHQPAEDLEKTVSAVGSRTLRELSRYLRGLGVIGNVTPLMGLLGTVFGMVEVFIKVADLSGNVNPSILANGIWEALLTTAAGLTVAIPALIAYHYFEGRVDDYSFRLESDSTELLQTLKGRDRDPVQQEKKTRD